MVPNKQGIMHEVCVADMTEQQLRDAVCELIDVLEDISFENEKTARIIREWRRGEYESTEG